MQDLSSIDGHCASTRSCCEIGLKVKEDSLLNHVEWGGGNLESMVNDCTRTELVVHAENLKPLR